MASSLGHGKTPWSKIVNDQDPLRIAVLGGSRVGKSSFITKLTSGIFQETHYPTSDFTTSLYKFKPALKRSRLILDELADASTGLPFLINDRNNIVLSSHLQRVFENNNHYDAANLHHKIYETVSNNEKLAKAVAKAKPVQVSGPGSRVSAPEHIHVQSNYYVYYYTDQDADDYTLSSTIDDYYKPLQITNSSTTIKNTGVVFPDSQSSASSASFRTAPVASSSTSSNLPVPQLRTPSSSTVVTSGSIGSVQGLGYEVPRISPILVEMVDTPAFNPNLVVPFLELSLGARVGEEFLHNLSNDPRLPIATKPLLVGSGAGELNGSIDGYVLMYSAIPSMNPPDYESAKLPPPSSSSSSLSSMRSGETGNNAARASLDSQASNGAAAASSMDDHSSFDLLFKIRSVIYESWKSYKLYLRQHQTQGETDVFSLTSSIKHLWKANKQQEQHQRELREHQRQLEREREREDLNKQEAEHRAEQQRLRQEQQRQQQQRKLLKKKRHHKHDHEVDLSLPLKQLEFQIPISDMEIPPMIVVCTHSNDYRASPVLIENGKKLARAWNCCFVSIDNETGYSVEESLSLLIREIVEREKRGTGWLRAGKLKSKK